jgi:cyanophycinase
MVKKTKAQSIAIIPSASFYPIEAFETYKGAFRDLNVPNIDLVDIREQREADEDKYLEIARRSDLIFFSGGDQVKLARTLRGTKLLELIKDRFFKKELSIAGSSAGAAAASEKMLYDGDDKGFFKGGINSCRGLGFLSDLAIDTHFTQRNRIPRLVQHVTAGLSKRGIGISEDTGVIISSSKRMEVIGNGIVTIICGDKIRYSNYRDILNDELFSVTGLQISFLTSGHKISLKTWKILDQVKKSRGFLDGSFTFNESDIK